MAKKVNILDLQNKKDRGEVITMLTAYDYPSASLVDAAAIDMILVGDSLGMVVLGYDSTVPVTMEEMLHHCRAVARGAERAFLVGDMPFMSYQIEVGEAVRNAGLTPGHVARLLRLHLDGEVVAFMRDRGEKVELRVRGLNRGRQDVSSVLDDPIALPGGGSTTFGALATTRIRQGRGVINHHNYRRAITVESDLDVELNDTVNANNSVREEWNKISAQFPNTDIDQSGELDDIQESLDAMLGLFLLGLGLIYLIIATQFRSYFQPMLILATIPMAFTGVIFGLLLLFGKRTFLSSALTTE